jgi:hypothetical protein
MRKLRVLAVSLLLGAAVFLVQFLPFVSARWIWY